MHYIRQISMLAAAVILFYFVLAPWTLVQRREAAMLHSKSPIPKDWDYVYIDRDGHVSRWYLQSVRDNPIGFAAAAMAFVFLLGKLLIDYVVEAYRREPASGSPQINSQ